MTNKNATRLPWRKSGGNYTVEEMLGFMPASWKERVSFKIKPENCTVGYDETGNYTWFIAEKDKP